MLTDDKVNNARKTFLEIYLIEYAKKFISFENLMDDASSVNIWCEPVRKLISETDLLSEDEKTLLILKLINADKKCYD